MVTWSRKRGAPATLERSPTSGADRADVAIVGAGILGLATTLRLLEQRPDLRIVILEKEPAIAAHQTGHNSGVVHAGLYYQPGSLKAKLCREGKEALERFCEAHAIPLERTGKLVSGKSKTVTDGPFAEKDMVGGYTLIEAKDIAHATELSMGCPIFEHGGQVEVRPVQQM